jgi:hypothetical protein
LCADDGIGVGIASLARVSADAGLAPPSGTSADACVDAPAAGEV